MGAPRIDWSRYDHRLGKARDADVAREIGADLGREVHQFTVSRRRRALGIERWPSESGRWFVSDEREAKRTRSLKQSARARAMKCAACGRFDCSACGVAA